MNKRSKNLEVWTVIAAPSLVCSDRIPKRLICLMGAIAPSDS
ncbi:MAG: hypothetical protein V7L26_05065 [Nostoc sp.]